MSSSSTKKKEDSKPGGGVPRVKTGPTRGQERSRNESGEWRKKRSDAGKPRDDD